MADKNTYYILLQPKLDKSSITEMENKFKQASKRIGANLGSALKSSVKGATTSMLAQLSVANILGNAFSNIMQAPEKVKSLAMELRQLAIQTKNIATIGDLGVSNFAGFYQGLQSAGFQGDLNDIREVFAETAKTKAKGGKFEGSKLETGELLAQTLQSWQNVGKKYGFNSQEFQDAKKEVEQIIGGVDTARKFESLVKSDKNISQIYKQGKKEIGIRNESQSTKIYEENLKKLNELSSVSQESRLQKYLLTQKIDPKSIEEIKKLQDSDMNRGLRMLSDSDKLTTQVQATLSMQKTMEGIETLLTNGFATMNEFVTYIKKFLPKEEKKLNKEEQKQYNKQLNYYQEQMTRKLTPEEKKKLGNGRGLDV